MWVVRIVDASQHGFDTPFFPFGYTRKGHTFAPNNYPPGSDFTGRIVTINDPDPHYKGDGQR